MRAAFPSQRKICFAATDLAFAKRHKCLYFIISDSFLAFRSLASLLSLPSFVKSMKCRYVEP